MKGECMKSALAPNDTNVAAEKPVQRTRAERATQVKESAKVKPVSELSPHEVGLIGENLAAAFIESHGWEIIEKNWSCYSGEADLVIKDGDEYAFVEVKTRVKTGADDPLPELNVTANKIKKYKKIIYAYQSCHPEAAKARFDVMAILLKTDRKASVHYIKDIEMELGYDEL